MEENILNISPNYFKEAWDRTLLNFANSAEGQRIKLEAQGWKPTPKFTTQPTGGGRMNSFKEETWTSPDGKTTVIGPDAFQQAILYSQEHPVNDPSENIVNNLMAGGAGLGRSIATGFWASPVVNKVGQLFAKYIAAPTAAGMTWDELQKSLTGETTTEYVSNYLQNKKGWNPFAADFAGGLFNPGYWINFGGTGTFTKPIFNKIGIGNTEKLALSSSAKNILDNIVPKSKFLTNVLDPIVKFIDRNLDKLQLLDHPLFLLNKPTHIGTKDLNYLKFVKNPSEVIDPKDAHLKPGEAITYLLSNSNSNNEKIFGDALRLKRPDVDISFYNPSKDTNIAVNHIINPLLSGGSLVDILYRNDDEVNPYLRGFEYLTLGKLGLLKFIQNRINSNLYKLNNYNSNFNKYIRNIQSNVKKLDSKYSQRFLDGRYWTRTDPDTNMVVFGNTASYYIKPAFNINKASFDDLLNFINKRLKEYYWRNLNFDKNTLRDENGNILARRSTDNTIQVVNETELKNYLNTDIDIVNYNTGNKFTGKITIGEDGSVNIPEEYINTLNDNINYVQNVLFPNSGIKVFGSAAGVSLSGFPHATHDIDFYITLNEINKLIKKGMLSDKDKINEGTYTYKLNPELFGDLGNIDLNVIEQLPNGMATGTRAEELYKQYFPDDYFKALKIAKANQENGITPSVQIQINKTPNELLEAMDPSSKTIMDAFDIDFNAFNKSKHKLRAWTHLVYSDPIKVAEGLDKYAKSMLGSKVELFPMSVEQLSNKELNLQALDKLGVTLSDLEKNIIASNPQKMKNLLDSWYLMDNTAMRYINGTWPGVKGFTPENFDKSATTWISLNNGGNFNGAGLNTTIRGDSGYSGTNKIKAFISPKTKYKSDNLLDLIDEINYNFGKHPDSPKILASIPLYGEEAVKQLLKVFDEKGWNFLSTLKPYTNSGPDLYASATRPFDVNLDFIGFATKNVKMNALIPRLFTNRKSSLFNNPLFLNSRHIRSLVDFNKDIWSPISTVFNKADKHYYSYNFDNKLRNYSNTDLTMNGIPFIIPGGALLAKGLSDIFTSYQNNSINNTLNQWINEPDEIIKNMPEKDRKKFTSEGMQELFNEIKARYALDDDSEKNQYLYGELKEIYDKYKNK